MKNRRRTIKSGRERFRNEILNEITTTAIREIRPVVSLLIKISEIRGKPSILGLKHKSATGEGNRVHGCSRGGSPGLQFRNVTGTRSVVPRELEINPSVKSFSRNDALIDR